MAPRQRITEQQLRDTVGAGTVTRLFDDDGDGVADTASITACIERATAEAEGILLGAFKSSTGAALDTIDDDPRFIDSVCWLACRRAGRRRQEWMLQDGSFPYERQGKEAEATLRAIAAGLDRFSAEQTAGANELTQPDVLRELPVEPIFAPSQAYPYGTGKF